MDHSIVIEDTAHDKAIHDKVSSCFSSTHSDLSAPCSHDELLSLDQKSSYTAVSNDVMKHILSNRTIACCSRLWLLIRFEQSGFHDRDYISRTIGWLADALNVSTSTIQKWQRKLVQYGYLVIVEQRVDGHHNAPNQYRACLPKAVISRLKKDKKRSPSPDKRPMAEESEKAVETRLLDTEVFNDLFPDAPEWFTLLLPVLKFEWASEKLWVTGVTAAARTIILGAQGAIVDRLAQKGLHTQSIAFNRDQRPLTAKPPSEKKTLEPSKLFPHTKHRLLKRIAHLCVAGAPLSTSQAASLCNEVVYAMNSGSLKHLSTCKAMNVAIKLIRENRWRTPYGLNTS